jgi:hypothetical protein
MPLCDQETVDTMHACHYVIRRQLIAAELQELAMNHLFDGWSPPIQRLKTRNLLAEVSASKDDAIGWENVQKHKTHCLLLYTNIHELVRTVSTIDPFIISNSLHSMTFCSSIGSVAAW